MYTDTIDFYVTADTRQLLGLVALFLKARELDKQYLPPAHSYSDRMLERKQVFLERERSATGIIFIPSINGCS